MRIMQINNIRNRASSFKKDLKGTTSLVFALSAMVMLMASGASIDINNLTRQKDQAQHLADTMALAASIAVDRENDDRFIEGTAYSYEEVTGQFKPSAAGMLGSVEYDIVDDEDANNEGLADDEKTRLLARATVSGVYKSAFAGIFPKYSSIEYEVTSDVAYSLAGGKPASVFFAVDNSGSMGWLDSSGANKLASLETSMQGFMDVLSAVNTDQNDIFRTALYPYSQDYDRRYNTIDDDGLIPNRVVDPQWGTLSNGKIISMSTLYGTDSSGALEDAAAAFTGEDTEHYTKNEEPNPLKYMIFMSDGSNNSSYECQTEEVWVPGENEYWLYTYTTGGNRGRGGRDRTVTVRYNDYSSWMSNNNAVTYYPGTDGYYDDQEVCSWDYYADTQSIASCNAMKNDGVTVYSIGYSLIAGANGVTASEITRAKNLLETCASSPDHYVLAANAAQLDEVFDEIGEEIIEEVIRVKR